MPKLSLTFYQSCVLPIQTQIQKNFSFLLKGLAWNAIFVNAKIYYINIGEMTCFEPTNRKISMILFNCIFFSLSQLINDDLCVNRTLESMYLIPGNTQKGLSQYSVHELCLIFNIYLPEYIFLQWKRYSS